MIKFVVLAFFILSINIFAENISIFQKDNLYGYKENSKIILPSIYEEARHFNGGYAIVKKDGFYGVIDKKGNFEIKPKNANIYFATNEVLIIAEKYINKLSLYSLEKHKKLAENIEKITYISNENGVIYYKNGTKYDLLFIPNYKICKGINANFHFLDKSHILYEIKYSNYKEEGVIDLSSCKKTVKNIKYKEEIRNKKNFTISIKNSKCILKDSKNNTILNKKCNEMYFDEIYPLVYSSIMKTDIKTQKIKLVYEIYNLHGKKLFNEALDFISGSQSSRSLDDGTLAVKKLDGKYGLIDIEGHTLLNFEYDEIFAWKDYDVYFADKYVKKNRTQYIISNDGHILLEANCIYSIQTGLVKYENNGKIGLVTTQGNQVIDEKYQDIIIDNKKYIVKNIDGQWGVIDSSENMLIPFKYDFIDNFHNSVAVFKKGKIWGYITDKGKEIFKVKAEYLSPFLKKMVVVIDNKLCDLKKRGDMFNVECK